MDLNPYESPAAEKTSNEGTTVVDIPYYRPDSRRLTMAEYWRLSKSLFEYVLAVVFKVLRLRIPMEFAFGAPQYAQRVDPAQISAEAREALRPVADEATALGLRYALTYSLPTVGRTEALAVAFGSSDGCVLATVVTAKTWNRMTIDRRTVFALHSRLADGRTLVTSGGKHELEAPPHLELENYPHRSMRDVLERHRQRLASSLSPVVPVRDGHALEEWIRMHEQQAFDFHVRRGTYVPVPPAEVERLRQVGAEPITAKQVGTPPLQGLELVCWITLGLSFMLWTNGEGRPAQLVFRFGLLSGSLIGLTSIWIYRAVKRRREANA